MDRVIKPSRLLILILIILALTSVFMLSLYRLQIVEGEEYYARAQSTVVSKTSVAAVRGNLLDRYGRPLTYNRTCNNLIINATELFEQEDPNAVILKLTQEVEDSGNTYNDTLPITKRAPFEYKFDPRIESIQRTRLQAYLEDNDLPASTSAVELMSFFRSRYKIDNNYNSDEMRTIAAIRYEINIRYVINTSDYIFAEDVDLDLIARLMENNVPGFDVTQSYVREYNTKYGAHLLGVLRAMDPDQYKKYKNYGYSLNALVGQSGAELAFEEYLHGIDGEAIVTTTPGGTVINTHYVEEPQPGSHCYLTIDIGLQEATEIALASYIESTNAQREIDNAEYEANGELDEVQDLITEGGVAVIDAKTFEPLALASYPTFDIENYFRDYTELSADENSPLLNRATSGCYAPGSTFKPLTALAALSEKKIDTGTTVYCSGIYDKYEDEAYAPQCWIYPGRHGDMNVISAIENSCNCYFYYVGENLGIDLMSEYAKRFGLGVKTGIEIGEEAGIMPSEEYKMEVEGKDWYVGDSMQAAIGQSYSMFTPLQLATYTATVANNGTRYKTSMLKSVRSYDYSDSIYQREPELEYAVNPEVTTQEYFDAVHQGMYKVAHSTKGSAYSTFGVYEVDVAAKTGTSQLGEGITNNGVFICYAPYDDPEIAIAVVIKHGTSGSRVAPIARSILDYYFTFKNSTISIETENSLLK